MRLPALARVAPEHRPTCVLTKRDVAIIVAVARHRALTSRQIERLFFPPSPKGTDKLNTRCQRRLQLLYQHAYLARDSIPTKPTEGRKPLVYFLDRRGEELLRERDEPVVWNPAENDVTWLFLDHLLATNDVVIAMSMAAGAAGYSVSRWLDDRTLRSRHTRDEVSLTGPNGKTKTIAIIPDGYLCLDLGETTSHLLLEIDRGTMTAEASRWGRRDFSLKVRAYIEYIASGRFQERYGGRSPRVLTVTTTDIRLAHLKAASENGWGGTRFWFTTFDRLTHETVLREPIWQVATETKKRSLV